MKIIKTLFILLIYFANTSIFASEKDNINKIVLAQTVNKSTSEKLDLKYLGSFIFDEKYNLFGERFNLDNILQMPTVLLNLICQFLEVKINKYIILGQHIVIYFAREYFSDNADKKELYLRIYDMESRKLVGSLGKEFDALSIMSLTDKKFLANTLGVSGQPEMNLYDIDEKFEDRNFKINNFRNFTGQALSYCPISGDIAGINYRNWAEREFNPGVKDLVSIGSGDYTYGDLIGLGNKISAMACNPNDANYMAICDSNGNISILDLTQRKDIDVHQRICSIQNYINLKLPIPGLAKNLDCKLQWSNNGKYLAAGCCYEYTNESKSVLNITDITVWDVREIGDNIKSKKNINQIFFKAFYTDKFNKVNFVIVNNKLLLISNGNIFVLDLQDPEALMNFRYGLKNYRPLKFETGFGPKDSCNLLLSPDGKYLAADNNSEIRLYSVDH